ncbi:MAG TPA: hypothetical protein PKE03_09335 [Bacteroidales bacterium]|nr:hypothetical protein [Bacteroidales bacterium]
MEYQISVEAGEAAGRRMELWVDQLTDDYHLDSSYYGALSVLLDALVNHFNRQGAGFTVKLSVDENGFEFRCHQDVCNAPLDLNLDNNLKLMLDQLCNNYQISGNVIVFRLAAEGMPLEKVKMRHHQLSDYFEGRVSTANRYDKLSKS